MKEASRQVLSWIRDGYIFELAAPVTTQSVRVQYLESTGGNTGAKEIEFYGAD